MEHAMSMDDLGIPPLMQTLILSMILWMEEILHQLVDGLSHCNPIIYSVL